MSAEEMIWIMCKLALDDRMRDLISNFEGINFVSEWSDDNYLDDSDEAYLFDNWWNTVLTLGDGE